VNSAELRELDKKYLWHPFTHMRQWLDDSGGPLVITSAEGMYLIDSDGNRYLDGVSSLWCNVHGHRVPEIDQAIRAQLEKVAHSTMLGLSSEPAILLAEQLIKIAPPGLAKVFYSDAGATATEIAFKLAVQYWFNLGKPEKCEFVGFTEAYHGDTVGAMSIGRTTAFHRPYFPLLFKVHYAPTPFVSRPPQERLAEEVRDDVERLNRNRMFELQSPGWDDAAPKYVPNRAQEIASLCINKLAEILLLHSKRIAAVCIEPIVQGAAGMIVHPPGFLRTVRELCTRYDVLMIADEVAVGFGRTGKMFACEHENVSPDLMCLAKGITGGYLPLAATLATEKIFDVFLGEPHEGKTFFHGHTYTGNPLACAAALASLDLFEKNDLVRAVERKSTELAAMLEPLRAFSHVREIRQKGFMVGIELAGFDPKLRMGAELCKRIRKRGVILRPLGDVIVLMPPLAMGLDDLRRIVDALSAEIREL
jgi:adenosylmethionine-8-amino-7-oxononanoate aminotransferase